MRTVGQVARRFSLSRSTLLYYDSLGLLCPTARSPAGYRLYDEADCRRLEQICRYRSAGLSLAEIRGLLDAKVDRTVEILESRLYALGEEIAVLREQQRVVLRILRSRGELRRARCLDKEAWVKLLRGTGLSEEDMRRWHVEFERVAPEAHRDFLRSLGIPPEEVRRIRAWARQA